MASTPEFEELSFIVHDPYSKTENAINFSEPFPYSDLTDPDPGITKDMLERNLALQDTLRLFATISRLSGITVASEGENYRQLEATYGKNTGKVVADSWAKQADLTTKAKQRFAVAFGLNDSSEESPTEEQEGIARRQYGAFKREFGGSYGRVARENMLRKLIRDQIMMGQLPPEKPAAAEAPKPTLSDTILERQEQLRALQHDPNAGFMPATHGERTTALAMLSYFDEPAEYPLGPAVHLNDETYIRKQRGYRRIDIGPDGRPTRRDAVYGPQEAIRTMVSKGHEMGDYFMNAKKQAAALEELRTALEAEAVNPELSLAVALGAEHAGIPALLRHMDQTYFRDHGTNPPGVKMDVFRSHRNEDSPRISSDKNKNVDDAYTGEYHTKVAQKRIARGINSVTVGQAKQMVDDAIADQVRREAFWGARIYESLQRGFLRRAGEQVLAAVN